MSKNSSKFIYMRFSICDSSLVNPTKLLY